MQADRMSSVDSMNEEYIEKFDVIRRYHLNKLNDDELTSFEIYILENPDVIDVIEKEKEIHAAFKEHESLLASRSENTISEGASSESTNKVGNSYWWRGLAMAACLVVAVLAVFNFSGNSSQYALQPPVLLETFRGAVDNSLQVNGQPAVQFQIDMGPAELIEDNAFTAQLVDANGTVSFSTSGLGVDEDGWLFYILEDQTEILNGDYSVQVFPDNNPALLTSFDVQFLAP